MKILTKIILFFSFIIMIFLAFNISPVKADACSLWTTCSGYPLSEMCATFHASVNVVNMPSDKNIYIGCNGDNGNGFIKPGTMHTDPITGACVGQYCDGHYEGATGQHWCQGEIHQVSNGGTVDLTHCSCQNKPDGACLQVFLSATPPTWTNACVPNANPTINGTGSLPSDSKCAVTPTQLYCASNATTTTASYTNAPITIKCPTAPNPPPLPKCDLTDNNSKYSISWNSVDNATSYKVYSGSTFIADSASPYTTSNTSTKTFNVIAVNDVGPSGHSPEATCPEPPAPPPPAKPNPPTLSCNANSDNSGYTLTWSAVSGATAYNIYSSADNYTTPIKTISDPNATTTTMPPNHDANAASRTYKIRATTSAGVSDLSVLAECPCQDNATCPANNCAFTNACGQAVSCTACGNGKQCQSDNITCSCPTSAPNFPTYTCIHKACKATQTCGTSTCNRSTDSIKEGDPCEITSLSFTIGVDAIGTTGDRANPDHFAEVRDADGVVVGAGSTKNPVHQTRPVDITLVDTTTNAQIPIKGKSVSYDNVSTSPTYGKFLAKQIDLGDTPAGTYKVYVTMTSHLTKLLSSTATIVAKQDTLLNDGKDAGDLVAGDIVGDSVDTLIPNNHLTIEDYNVLLSCEDTYTYDGHVTCQKNGKFPELSDLDDNGSNATTPVINEYDYNLFLREFANNPDGDGPTTATTNPPIDTTTAPQAPATIASSCTDTTATVSWSDANDPTSSTFPHYGVYLYYCDETKATESNVSCAKDSATTTDSSHAGWYLIAPAPYNKASTPIAGLTANDKYTWFIRAFTDSSTPEGVSSTGNHSDSNSGEFTCTAAAATEQQAAPAVEQAPATDQTPPAATDNGTAAPAPATEQAPAASDQTPATTNQTPATTDQQPATTNNTTGTTTGGQ
jgi:hypothetical protein